MRPLKLVPSAQVQRGGKRRGTGQLVDYRAASEVDRVQTARAKKPARRSPTAG